MQKAVLNFLLLFSTYLRLTPLSHSCSHFPGFGLRSLKYLVMDEADRILNLDFEEELDKILKVIPKERRTYLFSATMTKKVKHKNNELFIINHLFHTGRM